MVLYLHQKLSHETSPINEMIKKHFQFHMKFSGSNPIYWDGLRQVLLQLTMLINFDIAPHQQNMLNVTCSSLLTTGYPWLVNSY